MSDEESRVIAGRFDSQFVLGPGRVVVAIENPLVVRKQCVEVVTDDVTGSSIEERLTGVIDVDDSATGIGHQITVSHVIDDGISSDGNDVEEPKAEQGVSEQGPLNRKGERNQWRREFEQ
nr:hypothetical protein [Natrinema salaciae]